MARLTYLSQLLLLALAACLFSIREAAAMPQGSRRGIGMDYPGAKLEMNERDELVGDELYDERGEMAENPRIFITPRDTPASNDTENLGKRQNRNFNYGTAKIRGVNIGGWLVTEPWITPDLYDNTGDNRVVDEFTFGQFVPDAGSRLERHFQTFYNQNEFFQIRDAGLNHVRIPIGFWALDNAGTPFYRGNQYSYLFAAVDWARNAGLKVIIDLHGAPGSQNGFDNSGQRGVVNWFNSENNKNRAKEVIRRFAADFRGASDVVTVIEILNEPLTTSGPSNAYDFHRDYAFQSYFTIRYPTGSDINSNVNMAFSDGFQPLSRYNGFLQPPQFEGVLLDTHVYSVFTPEMVAMNNNQRLQYFCNMRGTQQASDDNLWTFTGEWTNAPTDCARYLNGRGRGARYDGSFPGSFFVGSCQGKTGSRFGFSEDYKFFLGQMFDTQRRVYETASGWVFWTWKAPQAADWSYKSGLNGGWITRNLNSFNRAFC